MSLEKVGFYMWNNVAFALIQVFQLILNGCRWLRRIMLLEISCFKNFMFRFFSLAFFRFSHFFLSCWPGFQLRHNVNELFISNRALGF